MLPDEIIRVALFLILVGGIYVYASIVLIRRVLRRPRGGPLRQFAGHATIVLALIGTGCILYARFVEPYRLTITHTKISSSKIPTGARSVRIVHLSDIHSDATPRLEPALPDAVRQQNPDLILMTGDYFNSLQGLEVFRSYLTVLAKIAPTYVVKGNWESDRFPRVRPFDGTGAHELEGTAVRLRVGEATIWLAGSSPRNKTGLRQALAGIPPNEFKILLRHHPYSVFEALDFGVDLFLTGHTHGGQVALPYYGALVTLSRLGKKLESGLYNFRGTWVYVNRGVGMDGGVLPRVRFWSPPELAVIEIESAE